MVLSRLIDQSQILFAARVTPFLLEAATFDEGEALAGSLELIALRSFLGENL